VRIKYKSWCELFTLWTKGETDLIPCRGRWPYVVDKDILIYNDKAKQRYGVGIPATTSTPRLFYYLVSHWRERISDRRKLEDYGGVPVMPYELADALGQLDRLDLAPLCALDRASDDAAAMAFVQNWVDARGTMPGGYHKWRTYGLTVSGRELHVSYRGRSQTPTSKKTAVWDDDGLTLRLLSQSFRRPAVCWVKDAVYVAASRALGGGLLPEGFTLRKLGDVQQGGVLSSQNGAVIGVKGTPRYLLTLKNP
jgi:hypothetical protein